MNKKENVPPTSSSDWLQYSAMPLSVIHQIRKVNAVVASYLLKQISKLHEVKSKSTYETALRDFC